MKWIVGIFLALCSYAFKADSRLYSPVVLLRDTVPTGYAPQLFGSKVYEFRNYMLVDSFLMVMGGDTFAIPRWPAIKYKNSDNRWYGYHGQRWRAFLNPTDTISLSNRINQGSLSGLTAGRITYSTSATTIGDDAGLTYDTTANMVSTDSLRLFRRLYFSGDRTSMTGNLGAIRFGRPGDYFRESEVGDVTVGALWKAYPKYACDTCTNNQPFYSIVSTALYDVAQPPNSVFDIAMFGDGSIEKPLLRPLAVEQMFYDTWEIHLPEFKRRNDAARHRNISMAGNWTTGYSQVIYRFDNQVTTNTFATYEYQTMNPAGYELKPYNSSVTGGTSLLKLVVRDSTTGTEMGGYQQVTQHAGGSHRNDYTIYGDINNFSYNAGPFFSSVAAGDESFGRNFIFSIPASNSGRPLWVGKAWGSTFDQAFEVSANMNTQFTPVNTADNNFKVQIEKANALYVNGGIRLDGLSAPSSAYNILVHRLSDSSVYQIPASTFATGNTLYTGNGTLASDRIVSTAGFTTEWTGSNDGEASFTVTNTGTTNANAIAGTASGTTSIGVTGTSTSYIGVFGSSTSNTGIQGQSSSGIGVVGVSSTGAAFRGQVNPASTNAVENAVTLLRTSSSGAGANGLGAAIQYELETATSGTSQIAGSLAFSWSDATNATRTSQLEIFGVNSATTARKAALAGSGQWTWDGYGSGTFTGTPTATLQTTSTGGIIEGPVVAAGTYTPTLTNTTNVAASTAYSCQYMRVGNTVTVSGKVDIDPTAAAATTLGISLPIASSLANDNEAGGTGSAGLELYAGSIKADVTNDRAQLDFVIPVSGSIANNSWFFSFTYRIL